MNERHARFKYALARAPRMTAKQWAAQNGVTETHLYFVLKGERESASLLEKIDQFIQKRLASAA